jgi:hypothetical protein
MWSIRDKGKIDEEEMLSNYCFLQHMQCHYVLADGYKSQTSLKSRSGKQERGFFFFKIVYLGNNQTSTTILK